MVNNPQKIILKKDNLTRNIFSSIHTDILFIPKHLTTILQEHTLLFAEKTINAVLIYSCTVFIIVLLFIIVTLLLLVSFVAFRQCENQLDSSLNKIFFISKPISQILQSPSPYL